MTKNQSQIGYDAQEEPINADYEDMSGLADDLDEVEREVKSEFDADDENIKIKIKVYRRGSGDEGDIFLFNCQPADLPIMERIREEYGTGKYEARIYRNGKLYRRPKFAIEAPRKPEAPKSDPSMGAVAQALNNQSQLLENLVNRLGNQPVQQPPPQSMTEIMQAMATMMGAMREMMPQPAPQNNPNQFVDAFVKGIELAKEVGSGGESNIIDVIRDVAKSGALSDLTKNLQLAAPQKPYTPSQVQPQKQSQTSPENNTTENQSVDIEQFTDEQIAERVSKWLEQLIPMTTQTSPQDAAHMIMDQLADGMLARLANIDDLENKIFAHNPALHDYRNWFSELVHTVQADHEATTANIDGNSRGQEGYESDPVSYEPSAKSGQEKSANQGNGGKNSQKNK